MFFNFFINNVFTVIFFFSKQCFYSWSLSNLLIIIYLLTLTNTKPRKRQRESSLSSKMFTNPLYTTPHHHYTTTTKPPLPTHSEPSNKHPLHLYQFARLPLQPCDQYILLPHLPSPTLLQQCLDYNVPDHQTRVTCVLMSHSLNNQCMFTQTIYRQLPITECVQILTSYIIPSYNYPIRPDQNIHIQNFTLYHDIPIFTDRIRLFDSFTYGVEFAHIHHFIHFPNLKIHHVITIFKYSADTHNPTFTQIITPLLKRDYGIVST